MYTRHSDGHVRARFVPPLLGVDADWTPAFVVKLLGEYVIEIGDLVLESIDELPGRRYAAFAADNPAFMARTRRRIVSYWAEYYRRLPFEDYPAYRVLRELGLWQGREAGRLLAPTHSHAQ